MHVWITHSQNSIYVFILQNFVCLKKLYWFDNRSYIAKNKYQIWERFR